MLIYKLLFAMLLFILWIFFMLMIIHSDDL